MIRKIKKNEFVKHLIQLTMGSALAQIITILVSPLSTRLFSSEQLGSYTLFLTVVSIFGPILNLKYDMSIVKSKDECETINAFSLSSLIGIFMSIVISIFYSIYLFFNEKLVDEIGYLIYLLLPIILIGTSLVNTLTSYNNLEKKYGLISKVYVIRTAWQNVLLIIAGIFKTGALGLIISQTLSVFWGIKMQSSSIREKWMDLKSLISRQQMVKILKKEKRQFLFLTPATLLNTGSYSILNFLITSLYGLSIFGYYSISYRILGLPLNLISGNVSRVFYQKAVEDVNSGKPFYSTLKKFLILVTLIAIPMVLFLYYLSPTIFSVFFGKDWRVSGEFVRYLAPMYGIRLIVSSVSVSLIVANKQQLELVLQALFIIYNIVIFFVARFFTLMPNIFLVLISIGYSFIYLLFLILIIYFSRKKV
ncbi:lipopolysaccharide biosynthesis protein [Enterococcus gallinarum]|uniref:lipopolysaccharide biosynthesis protein n=1 Tax=Enterococcus gallinarum TaxID=1353 RepID=UPI003D12C59E